MSLFKYVYLLLTFPINLTSPRKGRKVSFEKSLGDYSIRLDSSGRSQVIEECKAFISISPVGDVNCESEKKTPKKPKLERVR